jgi:3-hydroxymyristoyl/3-hydroxydecanoyl-(acyl carrier protein) dehydratase
MRWLLLDEISEIRVNDRACAKSRIPEAMVHPEFLMIEMMVQTGSLLLGLESDFSQDVILTKIETAEFFPGWRPGDTVHIESVCDQLRTEAAWLLGEVRGVKGPVSKSRFLLMNVGHFEPTRKDSITFHKRFMDHFNIRQKIVVSSA